MPAIGEGTSVSTLSVDTSSSGSSTSTRSPTFFSQRVTVPSVTLSPSAGRLTDSLIRLSPSQRVTLSTLLQSCFGAGSERVQRLARQLEERLAEGLVLGRV